MTDDFIEVVDNYIKVVDVKHEEKLKAMDEKNKETIKAMDEKHKGKMSIIAMAKDDI